MSNEDFECQDAIFRPNSNVKILILNVKVYLSSGSSVKIGLYKMSKFDIRSALECQHWIRKFRSNSSVKIGF